MFMEIGTNPFIVWTGLKSKVTIGRGGGGKPTPVEDKTIVNLYKLSDVLEGIFIITRQVHLVREDQDRRFLHCHDSCIW